MKTVYFVEFDIDVDADKYGTYASLALTYAVANKKYSCRTVSQHRFPDSDSASSFMQRAAHCLDVVAATLAVKFVHFDYEIDETDARGVVAGEHAHECHEGAASVLSISWIWRCDVDASTSNAAKRFRTCVRSAKLATLRVASSALIETMQIFWADIIHSENTLRDTLRTRCGLGISEASGWILINQEMTNN